MVLFWSARIRNNSQLNELYTVSYDLIGKKTIILHLKLPVISYMREIHAKLAPERRKMSTLITVPIFLASELVRQLHRLPYDGTLVLVGVYRPKFC